MWFPDFDAEQHRYYHPVTRQEQPGVNRIIRQAGLVDASYFYEEVRRRGSFVHDICYLLDIGDLGDYDPQLEGSKRSYERLMADGRCTWDHAWSERAIAHQHDGYCGKPDRWGQIDKYPACAELKRGTYSPWHEIQVNAYARMRTPPRGKRWKPWLIYISPDGAKAQLVPCRIIDAEKAFIEALNLFYWRLKNGDRSCFTDKTDGNPLADFGFADAS
jgi:hypothetical protein